MNVMLKAFLALALGAGGVLLAQEKPKSALADDKALEGTYMIVSGEEDGKAIPAERIKGSLVRFTADRVVGTDKEKKEFFAANYTLETSKTPWVIKMKSTAPKEAEATGLVKKDKDTLTLIYALPGGESPKDFKTGAKQQLFVLKMADKIEKK